MAFSRNLAFRASAEVLAKGTSVVLMVVVARVLGREAFGEFSIMWASGWIAATASDLGLHLVAVREVVRGEAPAGGVARGAVVAKLGQTAVALVALAAAAPLLGVEDTVALWGVALALVALSYVDLAQHLLRARGAFVRDAAVQVVARVAALGGGLAGLAAGGLRACALGLLGGAVLGVCVGGAVVWREYGGLAVGGERRGVRWLLGRSLPVGAGIALSMLYFRIDLFLLDALTNASTVGLYAGAYRIFESTQLLPAVSMAVLFPRLAATAVSDMQGRRLRLRAMGTFAAVGAAVAVAGVAAAPWLVALFYGAEFAPAAAPLAVLACAAPLMYSNYLQTQDLISRGGERRYAALAGVALVTNVAINLALIPRYGSLGAAAATVVTEAVLFAGCAAMLWTGSAPRGEWLERAATILVAAALLALPFESDRMAIAAFGLKVTIAEALVAAAVVALSATLVVRRGPIDRALVLTAGGFVAALFVSAAAAPEFTGNAVRFTMRMAAGAAFGVGVAWLVGRRPRAVSILLGAFAAGVLVASCVGLVETVAPAQLEPVLKLFRENPVTTAGVRRVTATYGYPNTLAASVALALPFAAVAAALWRGVARAGAWCAVAVLSGALVLTYSRGGSIAAVAGLAVLGAASWPARRRVTAAAAVAILAIALTWTAALVSGSSAAMRPAESAQPMAPASPTAVAYVPPSRLELWRAAVEMFRKRPLLGAGPDAYRLSYGRYLGLAEWDHSVYANNLALELLATTGLVGFCAFLGLVILAARRAWNVALGAPADGFVAAASFAAVAALAALFVHGAVDYFLEFTAGYVPFWMLVGLVAGLGRRAAVRQ